MSHYIFQTETLFSFNSVFYKPILANYINVEMVKIIHMTQLESIGHKAEKLIWLLKARKNWLRNHMPIISSLVEIMNLALASQTLHLGRIALNSEFLTKIPHPVPYRIGMMVAELSCEH